MKYVFSSFCIFLSLQMYAQIHFTPSSDVNTKDFHSGVAMAVADMNGDGMDDIIRLGDGENLQIDYQTEACGDFVTHEQIINVDDAWNVAIGDINNDGYNDIMTSGYTDSVILKIYDPITGMYQNSYVDSTNFFAQAANFVDINNDGWLDAFICNDNGTSFILMNDGVGNLVRDDNVIDFTTTPVSDMSGNYGSIWVDIDSDDDLDLYIAKCRQGVTDPTDPRRINVLYLNDGNNHFTEAADSFGLAIGWQTWTADFADFDLDGDLDCFLTNHDAPAQFMENRGDSVFVDITASTLLNPSGTMIQGTFRDFDNDGWVDILVSGSFHSLWKNNGNGTFKEVSDPFTNSQMLTFGIGDLNHDGFLDVYGGHGRVFNGTTGNDDILFYNDGNANNHINFQLEGTVSNRNAVGARIELYSAIGMQIREVRAGEGYGISLSHDLHFGLGTSTKVDSVVIKWPSGLREVLIDMSINETHMIKEGGCSTQRYEFSETCIELCTGGETATLTAPDGFKSYVWSNGMVGKEIEVSSTGLFWATMKQNGVGGENCDVKTNAYNVRVNQDGSESELLITGDMSLCDGDVIQITAPRAAQYLWSNGDTSRTISVATSGNYSASLMGACLDWESDSLEVDFYIPQLPAVQNDTILGAGTATLIASGDVVSWFSDLNSEVPIFVGDTFITPEIAATTSFYASNFERLTVDNQSVGPEVHSGNSLYGSNQFNGAIIFSVSEPMILDSVTVYTEFPGPRIFQIFNENGELTFESDTVFVEDFKTVVYLNALLQPSEQYFFSTEQSLNFEVFGQPSPRLQRSDGGVSYPYVIDNLVSINRSGFGADWYYYFYDWKVRPADLVCESQRVEAMAVVNFGTGTKSFEFNDLRIQPNPANSMTTILSEELIGENVNIEVINAQGMVVIKETVESFLGRYTLEIDRMIAGMYFVKIHTKAGTGVEKLLIQD